MLPLGQTIQDALENLPILIIDDETKVRHLLARYLTKKAFFPHRKILMAKNVDEALFILENEDVGLIILDLLMPNKSGVAVLNEMCGNPKLEEIPVLVISAHLQGNVVSKLLTKGVRHILSKPFNYQTFVNKIFQTLGVRAG